MNLSEIVQRIDQRIAELKLADASVSDRSISIKARGNADVIRNLRRAANGERPGGGANGTTLAALANALEVRLQWLLSGEPPQDGQDDADLRELVVIAGELPEEQMKALLTIARGIARQPQDRGAAPEPPRGGGPSDPA